MNLTTTDDTAHEGFKRRARALGLCGLLAHWEAVVNEQWLLTLIQYEESERARRSLERRSKSAKLGRFKLMADFDWRWPTEIDRELIEQLFTLEFIREPANVIIIGENGCGKTMLAKNLAQHAVVNGYSALFVSASELLNDLAAQGTGSALTRRLRHYCRPHVLVIDELGYLASSCEHADLLFELVTRRYQNKPIILTSNKAFTAWSEVFPSASCVVALIDRLIHKAEVIKISADSYRLKEAKERAEQRTKKSSRKLKTTS
jgi:DNA replication protein DnaC